MFRVVVTSTEEQRIGWIEEAKLLCRSAIGQNAHNQVPEDASLGADPQR